MVNGLIYAAERLHNEYLSKNSKEKERKEKDKDWHFYKQYNILSLSDLPIMAWNVQREKDK